MRRIVFEETKIQRYELALTDNVLNRLDSAVAVRLPKDKVIPITEELVVYACDDRRDIEVYNDLLETKLEPLEKDGYAPTLYIFINDYVYDSIKENSVEEDVIHTEQWSESYLEE